MKRINEKPDSAPGFLHGSYPIDDVAASGLA
jgi:hypothetical protein